MNQSLNGQADHWGEEDGAQLLRRWGRHLFNNGLIFDLGAWLYTAMTSNPIWLGNSARLLEGVETHDAPYLVLDLGAGPATSALAMGKERPAASFIAFDLAAHMLDLAQRNRQSAGWSAARLALVRGDALQLPLASASVDIVTAHSFLYLVTSPTMVLREAYRVLRPGGRIAFLEPHAGAPKWSWLWQQGDFGLQVSLPLWRVYSWLHRRYTPVVLAESLRSAGFTDVTTEVTLGGFGIFGRGQKT
jgi:ubiquinone/menaquinone biosynthesis C-methylase UbiE